MIIKTGKELLKDWNDVKSVQHAHDIFLETKWVSVDNLIKELDRIWNKINKHKTKENNNYISKTLIAKYLGKLKQKLK